MILSVENHDACTLCGSNDMRIVLLRMRPTITPDQNRIMIYEILVGCAWCDKTYEFVQVIEADRSPNQG